MTTRAADRAAPRVRAEVAFVPAYSCRHYSRVMPASQYAFRRERGSTQASRFDADPTFHRKVDQQNGAVSARVEHRRSRIVSGHPALAHVGADVLVTERDVVPAGVSNLLREDGRRSLRPFAVFVEESVRHRE